MQIGFSPEAVNDLQRLVEFLEAKNPYAARRVAIDLLESLDRLKQFPLMGLPVDQAPDPEKIRDLYVGSYTLRYLAEKDKIYVLRIWHNRENEKND